MKKVVLLLALGCVLVGFTGCGSKKETLKCSGQEENMKGSIVGTFEKEKLTKTVTESTITYESKEALEDGYEILQLSIGMMNAIEGVEGSLNKKDLTVTMKVTADLSKMSSENIKDMFEKESVNKEAFKAYAKEQGFTCK